MRIFIFFLMAATTILQASTFSFTDSTGNGIDLYVNIRSDTDSTVQLFIDGNKRAEGTDETHIRTAFKAGKHRVKIINAGQTYTKTATFKKNELTYLSFGYPKDEEPQAEKIDIGVEMLDVVSDLPQIIGGINAITRNLVYPPMSPKNGVEGRVTLQFIVSKDGVPANVKILMEKPKKMGFGEAAIAALVKTRFTPAFQGDKPVPVKMVIPIYFELKK